MSGSLPPSTRHLLDRFSFGVTDELAADARARGADRWFESQLARSGTESLTAQLIPLWFPLLRNLPQVNWATSITGVRSAGTQGRELVGYNFARRIHSRHQVYESMVDFWSNLLYVPIAEDRSFPYRADFEFTAIRPHALGTYRAMLKAAIKHPAMTLFLTNDLNHKGGINENLGRELLELHTVGRRYSERDVLNASRMLTGYTVDLSRDYNAAYDANRHHTGTIKVLGFRHDNRARDGRAALDAMLDYLARHPFTARRIAERLCTRFVSDDPPEPIVQAVARAYRSSGTDIRATLRALVRHPGFQKSRGAKVWTPGDDVVRTARVMGLQPQGALLGDDAFIGRLITTARDMGHVPLTWPRPDGWPETSSDYLSATRVLRSWHHHYALAATRSDLFRNVIVARKSTQLPTSWPRTLSEVVQHQSQRLIGRPATRELIATVASAVGRSTSHRYGSAAAVSDRDYQIIRGTVLNSPAGFVR
ncbi:DUF1800 domain-containing protein [Nocardioides sp. R-C-SC26]|uniref:DUF1800 domain-containing protein n=1 Tax=Nocardioides sp. R-C-SC26 TaxID=2870414 RepID=UPI001E4EACC8|nr:DUF1800 domain-containing protein [Nocardioides sp. R-C-SC26]